MGFGIRNTVFQQIVNSAYRLRKMLKPTTFFSRFSDLLNSILIFFDYDNSAANLDSEFGDQS